MAGKAEKILRALFVTTGHGWRRRFSEGLSASWLTAEQIHYDTDGAMLGTL